MAAATTLSATTFSSASVKLLSPGCSTISTATDFSPSGAPRQVTDIDVDHPAVDNDPRAGTTVDQNRIDFNDPTIESHEAVERNLKAQV